MHPLAKLEAVAFFKSGFACLGWPAQDSQRAERDAFDGNLLHPAGQEVHGGRQVEVVGADEASEDDLLTRPSHAAPRPWSWNLQSIGIQRYNQLVNWSQSPHRAPGKGSVVGGCINKVSLNKLYDLSDSRFVARYA